MLQKGCRANAVLCAAASCFHQDSGLCRRAAGQRRLAARDRQRLQDQPGRWFIEPITDLVVESGLLVDRDDPHMIAQAVEQLWSVGLRIDRPHHDALDVLSLLWPISLGVYVDAFAPFPDASQPSQ